jgi:hypothetical protein
MTIMIILIAILTILYVILSSLWLFRLVKSRETRRYIIMFNGFIIFDLVCTALLGKFNITAYSLAYSMPIIAGAIGALIAFLTNKYDSK